MAGGKVRTMYRSSVSARKWNSQTQEWEDLGVIGDSINGQPVTWYRRLKWWWATKRRDKR